MCNMGSGKVPLLLQILALGNQGPFRRYLEPASAPRAMSKASLDARRSMWPAQCTLAVSLVIKPVDTVDARKRTWPAVQMRRAWNWQKEIQVQGNVKRDAMSWVESVLGLAAALVEGEGVLCMEAEGCEGVLGVGWI